MFLTAALRASPLSQKRSRQISTSLACGCSTKYLRNGQIHKFFLRALISPLMTRKAILLLILSFMVRSSYGLQVMGYVLEFLDNAAKRSLALAHGAPVADVHHHVASAVMATFRRFGAPMKQVATWLL